MPETLSIGSCLSQAPAGGRVTKSSGILGCTAISKAFEQTRAQPIEIPLNRKHLLFTLVYFKVAFSGRSSESSGLE